MICQLEERGRFVTLKLLVHLQSSCLLSREPLHRSWLRGHAASMSLHCEAILLGHVFGWRCHRVSVVVGLTHHQKSYPASTAIRGRSSAWGYLSITFELHCQISSFLYQFIDLSLRFAFYPYSIVPSLYMRRPANDFVDTQHPVWHPRCKTLSARGHYPIAIKVY
jgi:hypothetical protein